MTGAATIQVVVFRVGGQEFAFDILQVERILRYEPPARLPKAPDFLEGVITYEGVPVPVFDLRKRFELAAPLRDEVRLMVLGLDEQRVALIVDEVREVLRVDRAAINAPAPLVRGLAAAYIAGIITKAGRTIVMLQPGTLLTSTERLALTAAEMERPA